MKNGNRTHGVVWLTLAVAASVVGRSVHAIVPDDPGPADLRFTISSAGGTKPISPHIYGVNFYGNSGVTAPATVDRLGGNRWSAYNWETNASNAGKDYRYQNDNYLTPGTTTAAPGFAVSGSLASAASQGRALVVTVPMAGYVSGDFNGPVAKNDFAKLTRFKQVVAKKGAPLSLTPNETDDFVYTDEFVNWVETNRDPSQQVFYSLDNEPALWGETLPANFDVNNWASSSQPGRTHPEVHPSAPTFAEMKAKTIAHASAIKDVNPAAIVFGGVGYGYAEFTSLQSASDAVSSPSHPGGNQQGELNYLEWLLREVKNEEQTQGRKLMDVLDVHWYPEATGGGTRISFDNSTNPSAALVDARVQAPRSLWDATYTETSWITGCCSGGPIKLLKHIQRDIADFNPGTRIAITEYNYGGGAHISGGVAQADVLGIFGREGVYAATLWPLSSSQNDNRFTSGAMKMYLDYDGASGDGVFGDASIDAATSNIGQSAVYASVDSDDPTRMVLVAINRTTSAKDVGLAVTHDLRFDLAEVYQLTAGSSNPVRVANLTIDLVNAFHYTMPAMSVSTLVLRSFEDGDFTMDGMINESDLLVWQNHLGMEAGAHFRDGDNDRDGDVDGADFLGWQHALGDATATASSGTQTPEPTGAGLACMAALGGAVVRRRRGKGEQT